MNVTYHPIGLIRTPFREAAGMPIQPASKKSAQGTVEVFPAFAAGLADLDGFSHVFLIYHLHEARFAELHVVPFLDDVPRGLFATRAPNRPNPIGLSLVTLVRVADNVLHVAGLDMLDRTTLLDIKPYVPAFDAAAEARVGWLEAARGRWQSQESDDRFGR